MTNAARYGAGKPIVVTIEQGSEVATLSVQDQGIGIGIGIGIAVEDHARIFKQFERAVGRNEVSGLGLGLYIVRQILDAHDGTIKLESKQGQGAKFIVSLPLNR